MRYLLIALLLTGCATNVPITAKFPEAPKHGMIACPQLQTVPDDVKLSGLTTTVTSNYSTYYECALRVDQWQEWYEVQKRIFEGIVK
jgi:hypothetical protein